MVAAAITAMAAVVVAAVTVAEAVAVDAAVVAAVATADGGKPVTNSCLGMSGSGSKTFIAGLASRRHNRTSVAASKA
jgi:hypothetical protein